MTMQQVVEKTVKATAAEVWSLPADVVASDAGQITLSFLDAAITATARATHDNTRQEQMAAAQRAHEAMLRLDRGLYALCLLLPGVTDYARQLGLKNLLGQKQIGDDTGVGRSIEPKILHRLVEELPAQRVMKLFEGLRVSAPESGVRKANNARTRKLILRTILGSPRLELWSVKYRAKIVSALRHAWGERRLGIVRSILRKPDEARDAKERAILRSLIDKYAPLDRERVYECVAFILGIRERVTLPLLLGFQLAKVDLTAGQKLPPEVLEGIRGRYHGGVDKAEVLRLTAGSLTKAQRLTVQKRAAEAGVVVEMDPSQYDAVKLYVYAFENGLTPAIEEALDKRARRAAAAFPARFSRIGILVDASRSMMGGGDQKLRPMAIALALRDMLSHVGDARVVYAGGESGAVNGSARLMRPSGDTSLSEGLLTLLGDGAEAIFVISDGYENRPRGRFAETLSAARNIGVSTPVYHLSPVFAAESGGVRALAEGLAPTLPVTSPEALGISMLRGLLAADPIRGLVSLVHAALPRV